MRFSVIMASRLIPYPRSAKYLDQKIVRAIDSVLKQSFPDFELIVIADGCEQTKEIVKGYKDKRLILTEVKHRALFDNAPRNKGIEIAQGEYIIYCDIDDYYGVDHLQIIDRNLNDFQWVWYNDLIYNGQWIERACNIKHLSSCGTSNICHRRDMNLTWTHPGYAHDYHFIKRLLNHPNHQKIKTPEYFVCHIPGRYDL